MQCNIGLKLDVKQSGIATRYAICKLKEKSHNVYAIRAIDISVMKYYFLAVRV